MQVLDSFVSASGKDSSPGYFLGSRSAHSLRAHHHAHAHQAAYQWHLGLACKDWPVCTACEADGAYQAQMRCRYSIAETLTTPFLKRALVTLPYYKKVDPQHIAKEKGLKRILQWFQVHCEPRAKHALDIATWVI